MLHESTVDARTFALLKELMALDVLAEFNLVGGTALALQFGHRKSIDLDFFGRTIDKSKLLLSLQNYKDFQFIDDGAHWALFCYINDIKVDFVSYPYELLHQPIAVNGIRMAHFKDIAAMKINAMLNRGTKKDFWDIAELLNHMSIDEIISQFEKMYPASRLLISVPQAMVYFEDAENSPDPVSLNGMSWSDVKDLIERKVSEYLA